MEPLLHTIDIVLKKGSKKTDELIHYTTSDKKFLKYTITPYELTKEKISGALIQFQDITELKRLEAIRRDFVANVKKHIPEAQITFNPDPEAVSLLGKGIESMDGSAAEAEWDWIIKYGIDEMIEDMKKDYAAALIS